MAHEVEVKFRLASLPKIDEDNKSIEIKQGYLDFKADRTIQAKIQKIFGQDLNLNSVKEARIRAKGSDKGARYFLTLKSDGTLQRDEYEKEIDQKEFEQLWKEASLGKISKIRREIDLGEGLIAEVDEYRDNLRGLYLLEVEFDPETVSPEAVKEKVASFDSIAEDVTELSSYKNREMASKNNLEELEEMARKEEEQIMTEFGAQSRLNW